MPAEVGGRKRGGHFFHHLLFFLLLLVLLPLVGGPFLKLPDFSLLLLPLLLPYGRGEYTAGLGHARGASGNRREKRNFLLCSYFVGAVRKAVGESLQVWGGVYFQHGDGGGRETGEEKSRKLWSSSIASPLTERHPYKLAQPLLSRARYLKASSKARERYGMIHFNIGQKYLNFAFETHEAPSRNRSCKLESQHSSLVLAAQFRFQGQCVS